MRTRRRVQHRFDLQPCLRLDRRNRRIDQLGRIKADAPEANLAGDGEAQADQRVAPPLWMSKQVTESAKTLCGLGSGGGGFRSDPALRLLQAPEYKYGDQCRYRAEVVKTAPAPAQLI